MPHGSASRAAPARLRVHSRRLHRGPYGRGRRDGSAQRRTVTHSRCSRRYRRGRRGYGYRSSVATAVRQGADVALRITPATFPWKPPWGKRLISARGSATATQPSRQWHGWCVQDGQRYALSGVVAAAYAGGGGGPATHTPNTPEAWAHPSAVTVGPGRVGGRRHDLVRGLDLQDVLRIYRAALAVELISNG